MENLDGSPRKLGCHHLNTADSCYNIGTVEDGSGPGELAVASWH
jgi:hypothetical protein